MELSSHSNRNQMFMTSLDMMVEQESLVRLLDVFLDYMDTNNLPFVEHKSHTGRPAFPNRVLIGIYLYGYLNRIRSSRQLEKACRTNVELFWLNKNLKPCYKTIANFRKDNAKGFRKLFVSFREFCKKIDLYGKEVIAIDGSKFRGQNSMKNNYNIRKINKHLEYIENQQKAYLESLDTNDIKELEQEVELLKQLLAEEKMAGKLKDELLKKKYPKVKRKYS